MKPIRPKHATVIGQRVKVVYSDPGALVFDDGDNDPSVGRYRREAQEIHVQNGMHIAQERETVLHELLHACTTMLNLIPASEEDERIVMALAPVLLDALRRSPQVAAYLLGGR